MTEIYRCAAGNKKQTLAQTLIEARKSLGCYECEEKCDGPKVFVGDIIAEKTGKPKSVKKTVPVAEPRAAAAKTPAAPVANTGESPNDILLHEGGDIPGMTPEIDVAIRDALAEISTGFPRKGIAGSLLRRYGDVILLARSKNCGWQTIAKLFRRHGIHVSEKSLQKAAR